MEVQYCLSLGVIILCKQGLYEVRLSPWIHYQGQLLGLPICIVQMPPAVA